MVERAAAPDDEVGQNDRDDDDDGKGDDTHEQGVARGEQELFLDGAAVIDEGVAHAEERALAVSEAEIDDIELGKDSYRAQQIAVQVHEEAAETLGLLLLHGVQGVDREFEAPCCPLLEKVPCVLHPIPVSLHIRLLLSLPAAEKWRNSALRYN